MKKTIVAMFSGGLDSTAMLWLLLTHKDFIDYDVHVHHVHITNDENRGPAETTAVTNILDWFRRNSYRRFSYTESTIGYPRYRGKILMDVDVTCFFAGYIANSVPSVESVAFGFTWDDFQDPTFVPGRLTRAKEIFKCFSDISVFSPIENIRKAEIDSIIPSELRKLTWSCRTPQYKDGMPVACGKCKPCTQLSSPIFSS